MSNASQESESTKLRNVLGEKTGALSPEDSVQTAGERMRAVAANVWPVADGRKLVGAIDNPNPDHLAGGRGHDPKTTRVGEAMSHDAPYCFEDEDAAEAQRKMEEGNLNHLPVVDREMRIVGILSRGEVKLADAAGKDGSGEAEVEPPGDPASETGSSEAAEGAEAPRDASGDATNSR